MLVETITGCHSEAVPAGVTMIERRGLIERVTVNPFNEPRDEGAKAESSARSTLRVVASIRAMGRRSVRRPPW